jgi:hypothetical protein
MNNYSVKSPYSYKKILQICLRSFVNSHPVVNFINALFLCKFYAQQFVQSQILSREKTLVQKMGAWNVDEIDTWSHYFIICGYLALVYLNGHEIHFAFWSLFEKVI